LKKGTRFSKFDKKCDECLLLGYSTTSNAYRVWNLASGTLEKVHDVEFDETKGSQDEDKNLNDVRGIQLSNAMKNMDVGELKPRQVIDEEDDQTQVLSNSNMQVDINQASSSSQLQDQQVASTSSQLNASNQVQVLQLTNIARDHPLDTIIGDISRGVQTRSKLALFCEHFSFVSFIKPKKIEEALRNVDWVNAMHEELNNFTRNQVWELVERPKGHNVIGVFRNKQDHDGIIVRNKARLVAQGYTQVHYYTNLIGGGHFGLMEAGNATASIQKPW
jgi:hypothetical protein